MIRNAMRLSWVAWAMLACAPVEVTIEHGAEADLSGFSSYAQVTFDEEAPGEGEESRQRIHSEIDRELQARGYALRSEGEADLKVGFLVTSEFEIRLVNASDPDTDYYVPKKFTVDTLEITLFDAARGTPLWRGKGRVESVVAGSLIPDDRDAALLRAVRHVLAELPRVD